MTLIDSETQTTCVFGVRVKTLACQGLRIRPSRLETTPLISRTPKAGHVKAGRSDVNFQLRGRQRSAEGVVRRNGCPKGCFWRVRFFSLPLRSPGVLRANLKGAEKNGLSKNTLLDNRFSARLLLLRSFGAPPIFSELELPGWSCLQFLPSFSTDLEAILAAISLALCDSNRVIPLRFGIVTIVFLRFS